GMATRDEIEQLQTLPVEEAEGHFLRLMITHHQAGVEMAEAALERTDNDAVEQLATAILNAQVAEIEYMQDLLERKGFERVDLSQPVMDHDDHN
ncbi:MAG TPA: DUF305 domain-containing protein, partial [Thermomicrobiales bacterium]|nr:DUF305 domain-containing protein [Thermomicrobiales bacterium]